MFYSDTTKRRSYWKLSVISGFAAGESVFTLPPPGPGGGPAAFPARDVASGNTASSERAGSAGTITIHSFSCGPPTRLDATVDATLGSQLPGGAPIHVRGHFTAAVYTSPISCVFTF